MGTETIELLKNYTPSKLVFPVGVQEKIDGVPVRIERSSTGAVWARTRQGECIVSIPHIIEAARPLLLVPGAKIIGEVCDRTLPFKTVSGKVRDTKQQHKNLKLYVFDASLFNNDQNFWINRYKEFLLALTVTMETLTFDPMEYPIYRLSTLKAESAEMVDKISEAFSSAFPEAEGMVLHQYNKPFQPGKRCWGTQRIKADNTLDLEVVSFLEAISEAGDPKAMVGRINVRYKGTVIGIGPGKLTYAERSYIWMYQEEYKGKIAEIKYMPDPTYDALRQPTFQRWRFDKHEAENA